jgi:nitrate reductase gamma subunit
MTLAIAAAIGSLVLIIASQVKRRMTAASPGLDMFIRVLAVVVIGLVAAYFYQRVVE